MNRFLKSNKEADLSGITQLVGARVLSVSLNKPDHDLVLTMDSGDTLILKAPWQFVSCLEAISSVEVDHNRQPSEQQDPVDMSSICIGLEGANLTEIESDSAHMDLLFDSICISLKQIPEK